MSSVMAPNAPAISPPEDSNDGMVVDTLAATQPARDATAVAPSRVPTEIHDPDVAKTVCGEGKPLTQEQKNEYALLVLEGYEVRPGYEFLPGDIVIIRGHVWRLDHRTKIAKGNLKQDPQEWSCSGVRATTPTEEGYSTQMRMNTMVLSERRFERIISRAPKKSPAASTH